MPLFPIDGPVGPLTGLDFRSTSPTDATPLLLLHGIQGSARAWSDTAAALPRELPALAPNLRGRAGSPVPLTADTYSMGGFAADLDAVLGTVDRPAVIVGWSMGVLVALAYGQRYGLDRVKGLVLIGGTAAPTGGDCQWFKGTTLEAIAAEASDRARALALRESADPIAAAGAWLSARAADYRDYLPRIDVPTLIVHGTADDQCPLPHGRLLARHIAGARLETLAGRGHNLPAEAPNVLARAIASFHRSLS